MGDSMVVNNRFRGHDSLSCIHSFLSGRVTCPLISSKFKSTKYCKVCAVFWLFKHSGSQFLTNQYIQDYLTALHSLDPESVELNVVNSVESSITPELSGQSNVARFYDADCSYDVVLSDNSHLTVRAATADDVLRYFESINRVVYSVTYTF